MTFPGFVDVHVHFSDPGVPVAETTASGLAAAAHGGFAAVVTMPNTMPAGDSVEWVLRQRPRSEDAAGTVIFPSACITKGRLGREVADLEALAEAEAAVLASVSLVPYQLGKDCGFASPREVRLTEFADPANTLTYFRVPDPAGCGAVDDELFSPCGGR